MRVGSPGNQNSVFSAGQIAYTAPTLTLVSPNLGDVVGNTQLTLKGTNFGTPGSVAIGSQTCVSSPASFSFSDTTTWFCSVPASNNGASAVNVVVKAGDQQTSALTYQFYSFTSFQPTSMPARGGTKIT